VSDFITMPILRKSNIVGLPASVVIPMDRQDWARRNHSQSLERLAERGGLSPTEAIAIMLGRPWQAMAIDEIRQYFTQFGWRAAE
jgi:hypothetical protein